MTKVSVIFQPSLCYFVNGGYADKLGTDSQTIQRGLIAGSDKASNDVLMNITSLATMRDHNSSPPPDKLCDSDQPMHS